MKFKDIILLVHYITCSLVDEQVLKYNEENLKPYQAYLIPIDLLYLTC